MRERERHPEEPSPTRPGETASTLASNRGSRRRKLHPYTHLTVWATVVAAMGALLQAYFTRHPQPADDKTATINTSISVALQPVSQPQPPAQKPSPTTATLGGEASTSSQVTLEAPKGKDSRATEPAPDTPTDRSDEPGHPTALPIVHPSSNEGFKRDPHAIGSEPQVFDVSTEVLSELRQQHGIKVSSDGLQANWYALAGFGDIRAVAKWSPSGDGPTCFGPKQFDRSYRGEGSQRFHVQKAIQDIAAWASTQLRSGECASLN